LKVTKNKTPWTTARVWEQIYNQQLWGTSSSKYYSGYGSHQEDLVRPYIQEVGNFLKSFSVPVSLCDLGCGDFNVGRQLLPFVGHYYAIDIVPDLIDYNTRKYQAENLSFHCLDIEKDKLPKASVVIIRQVLQHLSNAAILTVLEKLEAYSYLLVTEHLPKGAFTPNLDILTGQGIRLKHHSGVNLEQAPFSLNFASKRTLLSLEDPKEGRIETVLYTR